MVGIDASLNSYLFGAGLFLLSSPPQTGRALLRLENQKPRNLGFSGDGAKSQNLRERVADFPGPYSQLGTEMDIDERLRLAVHAATTSRVRHDAHGRHHMTFNAPPLQGECYRVLRVLARGDILKSYFLRLRAGDPGRWYDDVCISMGPRDFCTRSSALIALTREAGMTNDDAREYLASLPRYGAPGVCFPKGEVGPQRLRAKGSPSDENRMSALRANEEARYAIPDPKVENFEEELEELAVPAWPARPPKLKCHRAK